MTYSDNLCGENFVILQGKISYKKYTEYPSGAILFKCSLAIPVPENNGKYQYIGVAAWGDLAVALNELNNGVFIKVYGHIEKSSYDAKCKYCGGPQKVYWTEVIIDNFITLNN